MPQAYKSWFVQEPEQGKNNPAFDVNSAVLNTVNFYPHTLKIYP